MNRTKDPLVNDFLLNHESAIISLYNPTGIWFFGSRINGTPREESDIDMIIVSDKFKGTKFIHRMGNFLKNIDYPRHIDAICYTPEEFEKKKNEIGIINEAIKTGEKVL